MEKPNNIPVDVLEKGAKDIDLYRKWGHYLAQDESEKNELKKGGLKNLSSSQIRRFFGSVKKIQADFEKLKGQIILLDPKLAYAVGRDTGTKKTKIKEFYQLISPLIGGIKEDKGRFKNFVDVFEAILAYHKEKEGEEKPKNN